MLLVHAPLISLLLATGAIAPAPYLAIEVVDAQTGRGVPLVELETVNGARYYTDSGGVVAFHEPGLTGQTVFFHVRSHGYEMEKDGFGYRGKALKVEEGGSARIAIRRVNVAERLYRMTGAGIYRDTVLLGRPAPTQNPVLNGQVFGTDSVMNAVYRGRIYWFWGDTHRPAYPLGNFNVSGASSLLPAAGGLDPEKGVDLEYWVNQQGFAREMAPVPGQGTTWVFGLVTLRDRAGRERLLAGYCKYRHDPGVFERGLVEYDDATEQFRKVVQFDLNAPAYPRGQAFLHTEAGGDYVYFADPYPLTRVPADPDRLKDPAAYETYTCLKDGTTAKDGDLDRAPDGTVRYAWRRNTPAVGPREQADLIKAGKLRPDEVLLHLQDSQTGKAVVGHQGSVYWNAHRRRWVLIALEIFGTSMVGEVWYAEADTPIGPWVYARKVVTHDRYSFYNPKQHPMFDKEGGRVIFFEGTYSSGFSGNPERTPRYDYNQIMYRLDLDDPRLNLPVAVYEGEGRGDAETRRRGEGAGAPFATAYDLGEERRGGLVAFFALERAGEGTVPVYARPDGTLRVGSGGGKPVFHALPADAANPPATTVPLYEYADGARRHYAVEGAPVPPVYQRAEKPLCRVWRNPMRAAAPRAASPGRPQ